MFKKLLAKRETVRSRAANLVSSTKEYYRDNPTAMKTDIATGLITLLLFNIENDIEDVEEYTGVSAAVDYHNFHQ